MSAASGAVGQPHKVIVNSSGLRLVGERWPAQGRERGTILMLPGGGQTRHAWDRAAQGLQARGWTAVTMDLRGHGESDWDPAGEYSADVVALDVLAALEAVGADAGTRPVLVGASMGGMAALLAAGRQPAPCSALVLVDIALRVEPEGSQRIRAFMAQKPDGFSSLEEAAEAIAAYRSQPRRTMNLKSLAKNLRRAEDGRWHWHWDPRLLDTTHDSEDPAHPVRVQLRAAAAALSVPVLVVRGLLSDVVSDESLEEARRLLPDAKIAEVSGVGHMVAGDDNVSFLDAICGFLDSMPQSLR